MGTPRNVGGIRASSGLRRRITTPEHYLTENESETLGKRVREGEEAKGIFRRWNGRKLSAEQQQLAHDIVKRQAAAAKRKAHQQKKQEGR